MTVVSQIYNNLAKSKTCLNIVFNYSYGQFIQSMTQSAAKDPHSNNSGANGNSNTRARASITLMTVIIQRHNRLEHMEYHQRNE